MASQFSLVLMAFVGLLLLIACRPTATPGMAQTMTPTPVPSVTRRVTPTAAATPALTSTPTTIAAFASPTIPPTGRAGNADVLHVRAVQAANGTWTFHVTVQHSDTGWEDYANGWDVLTSDGTVIKPDPASPFTRLLLHPHVNEQPFTRSQSGIVIPSGVTQVRVRAHDLVDGYGGREVVVDLSVSSGPDFEMEKP